MPSALPIRVLAARRSGTWLLAVPRAVVASLRLRRVEGAIARARAEGAFERLAGLLDRRIALHERLAALAGATVPGDLYAERDALILWLDRDLRRLDRETRRLAWAEARKRRAEAAGDSRTAARAHALGQAACDRMASLARR